MGQRFGKLTVIGPAENIDGRTAWLCRCDCGSEIAAKTYHLRAGKVRSCGCLWGESRPARQQSGEAESSAAARGKRRGYPEGLNALHFIDGTCVEMLRKNTLRSNNTSGAVGVEWRRKERCWRASICFKGKRYYLGRFANFDDALAARKKAESEMHEAFLASIAETEEVGGLAGGRAENV